MTKKNLLFLFGFIIPGLLTAQTSNLGNPLSLQGTYSAFNVYHEMPAVDAFQEMVEDETKAFEKVFRFGVEHTVHIDIPDASEKKVLPNGDILYRYGIYCPNALSVSVIFNQFELPKGARLYLVAGNGDHFVGAYTSLNNNTSSMLGTELVSDQRAIIELIEPAAVAGKSKLQLGTVVHGYRDLQQSFQKAFGTSGSCNYDVNCPIGIGWEDQRNSVGMTVSGGFACSGSLVNNTSGTIIPYYLSARHCGTSPGGWVLRFRWERAPEHTICAAANSMLNNGPTNMTINGAILRATDSGSDFILLELNQTPDPAWGIYYNGWDHSDALTVTQGTGIHHPSSDIKKIARDEDPLTQISLPFNGDPDTKMWKVTNWEYGVTQGGSSGSPLFDQNHRVIGVLSGGTSECNGLINNGGYDAYGRFGIAWDQVADSSKSLKYWLDPQNTGAIFIDGIYPTLAVNQPDAGSHLNIYPNPANDFIQIITTDGTQPEQLMVFDVSGKLVLEKNILNNSESIDVQTLHGLYIFKITTNKGVVVKHMVVE